jgi:hypothetical protein
MVVGTPNGSGPLTANLGKVFVVPHQKIEGVFKRVRTSVYRSKIERQALYEAWMAHTLATAKSISGSALFEDLVMERLEAPRRKAEFAELAR